MKPRHEPGTLVVVVTWAGSVLGRERGMQQGITRMESSLKAGEVQLKRSGSSQPFSSSQCLTAAPEAGRKRASEGAGHAAPPTFIPPKQNSAPGNPQEQHQRVMGKACGTPELSSCCAPASPLVCITSASCCQPLSPGAGSSCGSHSLHGSGHHHRVAKSKKRCGRVRLNPLVGPCPCPQDTSDPNLHGVEDNSPSSTGTAPSAAPRPCPGQEQRYQQGTGSAANSTKVLGKVPGELTERPWLAEGSSVPREGRGGLGQSPLRIPTTPSPAA